MDLYNRRGVAQVIAVLLILWSLAMICAVSERSGGSPTCVPLLVQGKLVIGTYFVLPPCGIVLGALSKGDVP